jgi:hypothetical protein
MPQTKVDVYVFLTRNKKLRARIKEPGQKPYEVSLNGEQWKKGKGRKHKEEIKKQILYMQAAIKKELNKLK